MLNVELMTESKPSPYERKIMQAYMMLHAQKRFDVPRSVSLAQYGSYEVRLVEPSGATQLDGIPFWLELFDHACEIALDSYGSSNLEEAGAAAEHLISQAIRLHEEPTRN